MMIDVLQPLLCTWEAKWAERLPSKGNEAKSKMKPFRYAHTKIQTQVLVICGPMRYQLDHRGAPLVNECLGFNNTIGQKCCFNVNPKLVMNKCVCSKFCKLL